MLYYIDLRGTVVVVIVWQLDLQLPVQSVHITTKFVSSNPVSWRDARIDNPEIQMYKQHQIGNKT
jgi:hypothetical protein